MVGGGKGRSGKERYPLEGREQGRVGRWQGQGQVEQVEQEEKEQGQVRRLLVAEQLAELGGCRCWGGCGGWI